MSKKIYQLTAISDVTLNNDTFLMIVGNPSSGQLYKPTIAQMKTLFAGTGVAARFGVSGEDDTADNDRIFSTAGFHFQISGDNAGVQIDDVNNAASIYNNAGFVIVDNTALKLSYGTTTASLPDDKTGSEIIALLSDLPQVADDYADDAAAALGGIGVGELYHTSGILKIRLS